MPLVIAFVLFHSILGNHEVGRATKRHGRGDSPSPPSSSKRKITQRSPSPRSKEKVHGRDRADAGSR